MESDEENEEFVGVSGTIGCIILIDVSSPMWKLIDGERPIDVVLGSCSNLIKKIMINSPKQLIGISLFGTKKYDNPQGIENVVQLMELKESSVSDIKKLKELSSNPDEILNQWGITDSFSLADALWQASRMFSSCSKKMSSQTLTLISALKQPDQSIHKMILKKASDGVALGININVINVSDKSIPSDSFFIELGKVINEQVTSDWEPPEPMMDADDIFKLLWVNHHRKSASANLKMYLGPDVVLGVGLYHLCKPNPPPKKHYLHRDTNDLVVSSSTMARIPNEDEERGQNEDDFTTLDNTPTLDPVIMQSDITYSVNYGGRKIELTKEEHIQLRKFAGTPSIKLLGFKPESTLNMSEWFLSASAFIYPNETLVEGSSKLFLALRDRCLVQRRVAICLLVSRWFSNAKFVALVPQRRVMNGNCQIQPDGFHVVYLPYADNLKDLPMDDQEDATSEQKVCMGSIINKLKFKFVGDMFENPKLQSLYKAIEALALDEAKPEEIEDTTIPDIEEQTDRLGKLSEDFQILFGPMNVSAVKRSRNSETANKKVAANDSEQIDADMVAARLKNSTVERFTVPLLKTILKNYVQNPPSVTGLKKDQLVQLVYDNSQVILSSIPKSK